MHEDGRLEFGLEVAHEAQHVEQHVRVGGRALVGPLGELQLRHAVHCGGRRGRREAAGREGGTKRLERRWERAGHVELV